MLTGLRTYRQFLVQIVLILIGIAALVVWLRTFDVAESLAMLRQANLWWVAAFIVIHSVTISLRAFRWRTVIRPLCPLPLRSAGEIYFLGEFLNATFAMRTGDVTKAAMLRQQGGLPVVSGLSLLFADKIFELWGLISITALGFVLMLAANQDIGGVDLRILAIYPVLMIGMIIALRIMATEAMARFLLPIRQRGSLLGRVGDVMMNIADGLRAVAGLPRGRILALAALSSFIYFVDGLAIILLFWSVGATDVSAGRVLLASCMTALIFVLPAAPGYVGTLTAGFTLFFSQLEVAGTTAVGATAILFHAALYLGLLLLALLSYRQFGFLIRWQREGRHLGDPPAGQGAGPDPAAAGNHGGGTAQDKRPSGTLSSALDPARRLAVTGRRDVS